MCRRCGAPDRRPGAARRRVITRRLLEKHGNGVVCPCTWCGALLGAQPGYLAIPAVRRRIPILKLERDRLMPGGPYSLWNLVPSCGPCNKNRAYDAARAGRLEFPDGCHYGTPLEAAS